MPEEQYPEPVILPNLSEFEQTTLNDALETLRSDIKIGEEFVD